MKIVIFTAWGGAGVNPVLKKLINNRNFEIIRIFSQGIHFNRISKYHPKYYLNYKDNVSEMLEREGFNNHSIIKSANSQSVINFINENNIEYVFAIGFGEILKEQIIKAPKKGVVNFHPGLLPENRGADPYSAVLINNIKTTGVTIHYIDEGIDTGDIILRKEYIYTDGISYTALQIELGFLAAALTNQLYELLRVEKSSAIKQDTNNMKYFRKPSDEHALLDFQMTSEEICRRINTFNGFYQKAHFKIEKHCVYVGSCEIIKNVSGYAVNEVIDQALGYLCVATCNGAVLLKDLNVDDLGTNLSNQLLNKIFNKSLKYIISNKKNS